MLFHGSVGISGMFGILGNVYTKEESPFARLVFVRVFNWPYLKICQVTLRSEKDLGIESFDCAHLPYPCK